jgi:hypothetical protein
MGAPFMTRFCGMHGKNYRDSPPALEAVNHGMMTREGRKG